MSCCRSPRCLFIEYFQLLFVLENLNVLETVCDRSARKRIHFIQLPTFYASLVFVLWATDSISFRRPLLHIRTNIRIFLGPTTIMMSVIVACWHNYRLFLCTYSRLIQKLLIQSCLRRVWFFMNAHRIDLKEAFVTF